MRPLLQFWANAIRNLISPRMSDSLRTFMARFLDTLNFFAKASRKPWLCSEAGLWLCLLAIKGSQN